MKVNNFNSVAPVYDWLAKLVFGSSIEDVQTYFLNDLPEKKRVLFIGGGTGKLLKHPFFSKACHIDYLELSENMIRQSKRNGSHLNNIEYVLGDLFDWNGKYDVIISNFFLDCFDEANLDRAVDHIHQLTSQNSTVLVSDFRNTGQQIDRILIRLMIIFFRWFSNLQADRLQDIPKALNRFFELNATKEFKNGLLFTSIYEPLLDE